MLPLLVACGQVPGPAAVVTPGTDTPAAPGVSDPAPSPSPDPRSEAICPADMTLTTSYASTPREFCLDDSLRGIQNYYTAETQCEGLHRRVCDMAELLGAARDGHLAAGKLLWIYSSGYDRTIHTQQAAGVFSSSTGQQVGTGYISGTFLDTHDSYCCQDPERP